MGRAPRGRLRRINPLVNSPKLEDEFYAYQPRTGTTLEVLYAFHRWSGLIHGRHAVAITYIGDLAGAGQQKNATQIHESGKAAADRFNYHLAQMDLRGVLVGGIDCDGVLTVDDETVRDHLQRLTGHRFYHCENCRVVLRPGAIYCDAGTSGCGTPVPRRPARAVAATAT
jgi:hypothetical protein